MRSKERVFHRLRVSDLVERNHDERQIAILSRQLRDRIEIAHLVSIGRAPAHNGVGGISARDVCESETLSHGHVCPLACETAKTHM